MSRKHSTLLKEEVDDEETSSGSDGVVKKREKEKDGEHRKKKPYKKGDKNEGYFNDSMTSKSTKTAAIGGAAVNPSAESITSPVHTQQSGVIPPSLPAPSLSRQQPLNQPTHVTTTVGNIQVYNVPAQGQGGAHGVSVPTSNWQQQQPQPQQQTMLQRLPPPPGPHAQMAQQSFQQMQTSPPIPQAQFATQNTQRQVYQATPPQQQGQGYQPPTSQIQGQNYQPPPTQQQGQVYNPPPPQGHQSPQGQNFQPPPQQQGQVYQQPPPQQQGQNYQPPPPQQQGQNYQPPPPQQQGQSYQPPPPQQQGQNYQPSTPQQQGQNYQPPPPQQGYYVAQYANQVPGYQGGGQPIPHAVAPQSPTGQGQDPNWQQYADGNWTGHPDQQRDGNWAAFDGSPPEKTPHKQHRKEITWQESPDNSSSGEEIESHDEDDEDEEQQELIRPPSPSKSSSSIEEEHDDTESAWSIQPDQYEYYNNQFKKLQPNEGGVIKGPKARDFFLKSNLPTEILSKVWHLSDINQDNALDLDEFCIAMHLVVAIRHGLDLPAILPYELLHHREVANGLLSGEANEDDIEANDEEPKPLSKVRRSRSQSDTSLSEDHHPGKMSRKTSVPTTKLDDDIRPLSPDPNVRIPRPKATNISLIDSRPGQLLPPPQPGQFPSWTPSKADRDDSDSAESDDEVEKSSDEEEEESRPLSPGQAVTPIPMPPLTEDETKEEEGIPTPPSSPKGEIPEPVLPDVAQVTRRLSRKSLERPRSAGDVNEITPSPGSDSSAASTPTNSSIGSDGKKEPPPPPPRRKEKGHSRSSSLDLNKLFGPKAKESRANTFGSPTSSQSSQTSQSGEVALPLKTEPKPDEDETNAQTTEENKETSEKSAKEENFADFSNFENFVKAQGSSSESNMNVPQGRTHRRSLSLDQAPDHVPKITQAKTVDSTVNGPSKKQEALPRPVPKLKPPASPPVKLLPLNKQTPRKDGSEERRLKTEPPKVVVKPLTKESKLQNSIRELKETNLLLSRLNGELQQENKEMMEQRISLELKLERLKPFKSK